MKKDFKKTFSEFIRKADSSINKFITKSKYTADDKADNLLSFIDNSVYWSRYNGPIKGNYLNEIHLKLCKNNVYDSLFEYCRDLYLSLNRRSKLHTLSTDTTFVPNKLCKEIFGQSKIYHNKFGVKISIISDSIGAPLIVTIHQANQSDSDLFEYTFKELINDTNLNISQNKGSYFLADKGYDSKYIHSLLEVNNFKPIIDKNKRNNRSPIKMSKNNRKKYNKRNFVEHTNAWLKQFPILNIVSQKNIKSFYGLVKLALAQNLFKKYIKKKNIDKLNKNRENALLKKQQKSSRKIRINQCRTARRDKYNGAKILRSKRSSERMKITKEIDKIKANKTLSEYTRNKRIIELMNNRNISYNDRYNF